MDALRLDGAEMDHSFRWNTTCSNSNISLSHRSPKFSEPLSAISWYKTCEPVNALTRAKHFCLPSYETHTLLEKRYLQTFDTVILVQLCCQIVHSGFLYLSHFWQLVMKVMHQLVLRRITITEIRIKTGSTQKNLQLCLWQKKQLHAFQKKATLAR